MNFRAPFAAAVICAALSATPALAQTQASPAPARSPTPVPDPCGSILSIVTRPTVSTSVCTVREGHADVETGYTNTTTTGAGGGSTVNYPQSFVRVGIGPHMEVSFAPPSFNRTSLGGATVSGSSDMNFGAKWELGYSSKALWGADVQISAPTGDPAFSAHGTQYTGNLNWAYTLSPVFSADGTIGFNSLSGANSIGEFRQYSAFIPSIEFTAALPGTSQLFAEYAYYSHVGPDLGGKSLIDFGYQKDLGAHVQFDIEYGIQPTVINGQQQHYVGAGLSFMN